MLVPVEKNKEYIVDIIDEGYEGEGIAKIDNFTIFIPGAILGEKVKILIVKVLSSHAFGKIVDILEVSPYRVEPDYLTYKRCGGCNLRHIEYKKTLEIKQKRINNLIEKSLNKKIKVNPVIGMENPYNYRNKAQYPLGKDKNGNSVIGIYANRTHEIIPMQDCKIQDNKAEKIAKTIYQYIVTNKLSVYDEKTTSGLFRHIMIRTAKKTKQIMCVLIVNEEKIPNEKDMIKYILKQHPEITTIVKNINSKNTNVILGQKNVILYGNGYIEDYLDKYIFKISPLSFYQVNPIQTEVLYKTAIEKAELTKEDILLDLYCGIGTIGIFAAEKVKKVYGIEIIEQAIQDAKENAKQNNINNIEFFAGDVEQILEKILEKEKITPSAIIVDPPRKGLDKNTIRIIKERLPNKLVYISCNPATLVRDLKELEEKYNITEIQPIDLFPFTHHCEAICCLKRVDN